MSDLYEKYGITKKEVRTWAEKTYPQFVNNEGVIAQLYLKQVKRVKLDPAAVTVMRGKQVTIDALKVGEWCIVEGVVGVKLRENTYMGCPQCMKKIDSDYCPSCGQVTPTMHKWLDYMVGDNSGDIVATLPPRIANMAPDFEGKVLRIKGVLKDTGEFQASQVREVAGQTTLRVEEKPEEITGTELDALTSILGMFPTMTLNELKRWHKERGFKTPLEKLLETANFTVQDGMVVEEVPEELAKEVLPPKLSEPNIELVEITQEEPEQVVIPSMEPPEKVGQEEIDKMEKILSVFDEISLADLEKWHKKAGLVSSLDALLKAVGAKIQDGEVVKGEE